jgi:hypothetical protein
MTVTGRTLAILALIGVTRANAPLSSRFAICGASGRGVNPINSPSVVSMLTSWCSGACGFTRRRSCWPDPRSARTALLICSSRVPQRRNCSCPDWLMDELPMVYRRLSNCPDPGSEMDRPGKPILPESPEAANWFPTEWTCPWATAVRSRTGDTLQNQTQLPPARPLAPCRPPPGRHVAPCGLRRARLADRAPPPVCRILRRFACDSSKSAVNRRVVGIPPRPL